MKNIWNILINKSLIILLFLPFKHFSQSQKYVVEDSSKYTYEMIVDDLTYFYANFEDYVHPTLFGSSEFGLTIPLIRIGHEIPKKDAVFFVGNIHAREDYSSKFLMKFTNLFLLNLVSKDFTYLNSLQILDSIDLYIMPVANPDGLKIAHEDWESIKDSFSLYHDDILLKDTYKEWKANGKGIDLNASFDDGNFKVKCPDNASECACSEGYKGCKPAEPKETKLLQYFVDSLKPIMTISFHTKGEVLFWADKATYSKFKGIDKIINTQVAKKSGYKLTRVSKYPKIYGCGLENYVRKKISRIGVCVELSPGYNGPVQHPDEEFNKLVWSKANQIPYIYLQNAVKYKHKIKQLK